MFYRYTKTGLAHKSSSRPALLLLILLVSTRFVTAQQDSIVPANHSIELQIFAGAGINNSETQASTFDYNLNRTLIVYRQIFKRNFNFCIAGDTYVRNNDKPYVLTPYLKRAFLQYTRNGLSITAGLLVLEQFKYQRKIWNLRYIDKTFQNKFNYGENRNIGLLVKHNPGRNFSYDFALTSGYNTPIEFYSNKYNIQAGQTFSSKDYTIRLFNSFSLQTDFEHIISIFITKSFGRNKFGLEAANKISLNDNIRNQQWGFSAFDNFVLDDKTMVFLRYDRNNDYTEPEARKILWTGIEYSLNNYLKSSVFYRHESPGIHFFGLGFYFHYT